MSTEVRVLGISVIVAVCTFVAMVALINVTNRPAPDYPLCPPSGFKIQVSDAGRFRYVTPHGFAAPMSFPSLREAVDGAWIMFDVMHMKTRHQPLTPPPAWATVPEQIACKGI